MKLLVDGFTTKITRADQELRVLVYPSAIDLSSAHLRHLAGHLTVRRREIGTRWRRVTPGRQALLVLAPNEAAALKCIYMALMSLDPTGKGRNRWTMRWKAPLNAFQIAFEGRLTPSNN